MITPKEWRRALGFALFVIVLTTIPYLVAWATEGENQRFSGAMFGVEDANSYFSKMRLGARGEWSFRLVYTPEPTTPEALTFLPYIAVGQIVGALVTDDLALPRALMIGFQIMRIAADLILILVMYRFIAQFIKSIRTRYHALILATLAGGLGWITLFAPLGAQAMPDLNIPEGFGFLVLYGLPHVALARAALLGGLLLLMPQRTGHAPSLQLNSTDAAPPLSTQWRGGWGVRLLAALLFNFVGLCVPFYLAVIYVLCGVWGLAAWIIQRQFPRHLAINAISACALTLPLFAYNALIFIANPAFAQWSAQNILRSPPVWEYVLAYAPLVLLALPSFKDIFQRARGRIEYALIIGWLIAVPIMVYLPINVQRRLSEGVIVPLAICAALGMKRIFQHRMQDQSASRKRNIARWLERVLIIFVCATTVVWLATGTLAAVVHFPPTHQPAGLIRAFEWLQVNAAPESRVLASWDTGNFLPVYTDMRPYLGLGPETLDAESKEQLTWRFYADDMSTDERTALFESTCESRWLKIDQTVPTLESCAIQYVIYSEHEWFSANGHVNGRPAFELNWMEALNLVYDVDGVQIYAVERAP